MDTISMEMCKSIDGPLTFDIRGYVQDGLFSERHVPHCTCPAFKFAKVEHENERTCKHLKQIEEDMCGWHQQYSDETLFVPGECPRCHGPTVVVLVAV